MRNDVVIGLDISPTHMGWSVWENGVLFNWNYAGLKSWQDFAAVARVLACCCDVGANIQVVVEETLVGGWNTGGSKTIAKTGQAIGRLLQSLQEELARMGCENVAVEKQTCQHWRSKLWGITGHLEGGTDAWKAKARDHCDEYHTGWRAEITCRGKHTVDHKKVTDVAEAICIGESVALDKPRKGMVQSEQEGER